MGEQWWEAKVNQRFDLNFCAVLITLIILIVDCIKKKHPVSRI